MAIEFDLSTSQYGTPLQGHISEFLAGNNFS
jgi:hypothetical protein